MAFSLFQAGSTLYGMDQRGSIVELTLPSGVTLDDTLPLRSTVMGDYAILVNSPSRPLVVDANLNVRVLCPDPPATAPTLAGQSGGSLSTTTIGRETFIVLDSFGNLIAESDYSPSSSSVTIASQYLQASGLAISPDLISGRRLYRTTNGTAVFFQWMDVDGNVQTSSIYDDLSDLSLATLAAPTRGTPPNLYIVAEFKGRLFGAGKNDPNIVAYTEVGEPFAWGPLNTLEVPRLGSDTRGATGLVRRRDSLGLGRSNGLYQITGTDVNDLRIVNVSENCGIESADSIAVYRDIAFFLWKDGIYRWDTDGIRCVTDGKIRKWFTSNSTFNVSRLQNAFGLVDPNNHKYRLYLASADSPVENCWIEYDFIQDKIWGPHFSTAMNPSAAFLFSTDAGTSIPIVGGRDGYTRMDRKRRFDDDGTGIDFDVVTANLDGNAPDVEKYFGPLSVAAAPQNEGTLKVYTVAGASVPKVTDRPQQGLFDYDLTQNRQRLGIVGTGEAARLRFRHSEADQDVTLRGFEIDPVSVIGRR